MNKLIAVFFIALLIVGTSMADIWSNCGSSSDHLQIDSVVITPDPPVKGQTVTVTASGTLNEVITSGNVHVLAKYGFITIVNENQDLCQAKDPIPCPIQAGSYSKNVTAQIPSSAPSGKYSGNVVITDQNSQQVACINFDLDL